MSLLGGIRPPIAVLSVLLLSVAGITALTLGRVDNDSVPEAVLQSQQHLAEDGAIALRASLDEGITDLNRTAALFNAGSPAQPDAVLDKMGSVYQKWRGTAVVEIKSGKLLAARGENVPFKAIDRTGLAEESGLAPRLVRLESGETRLLNLAVLSWKGEPQQLLVATSSLKVPGVHAGKSRAIAVVDSQGKVLRSDGSRRLGEDRLDSFAKTAAERAAEHPLKAKEPGSGGYPGVSGSALDTPAQDDRLVAAAYASLAGPEPGKGTAASGLGLSVVTLTAVAEGSSQITGTFFGLAAAGALLFIGILTVALLLGTVQRPLIRLFLESRRLTRSDLTRPVSVPRTAEAARVGAALERLRRQLLGLAEGSPDSEPPAKPSGGRRLGSRALLVVCAALLLAWSAPLMLLLNRAGASVDVPQRVVTDQRERTDTLSDRVRRALNEGHADLTAVASLVGERTEPADMTTVLRRTLAEHHRYQSLYVLGADGKTLATAGGEPRGPKGKGPSDEPLRLLDTSGKEPVIVGTAAVPGRKGVAVVGELRIDFLNALLDRPGLGEVRVVDRHRNVIGSNRPYRAFEELSSDRLNALVDKTEPKGDERPEPRSTRDGDHIAAAAPFTGGGVAQDLAWTVVSEQPTSGLAIPENKLQNRTILAGLLGVTAAAACLGWLFIVVVRPLRQLADQAEALADGDRRTVLYPRHHDEVGAVTRSLELIRQQLQDQRKQDQRKQDQRKQDRQKRDGKPGRGVPERI